MASELTVTILRYAFLALIWFFVFLVVSAARRDLGLGKNYRAAPVDAVPEATHIAPPPARPSQLVITAGAQAGAMMQLGDHRLLLVVLMTLRCLCRMITPRAAMRVCSLRVPVGSLRI